MNRGAGGSGEPARAAPGCRSKHRARVEPRGIASPRRPARLRFRLLGSAHDPRRSLVGTRLSFEFGARNDSELRFVQRHCMNHCSKALRTRCCGALGSTSGRAPRAPHRSASRGHRSIKRSRRSSKVGSGASCPRSRLRAHRLKISSKLSRCEGRTGQLIGQLVARRNAGKTKLHGVLPVAIPEQPHQVVHAGHSAAGALQ